MLMDFREDSAAGALVQTDGRRAGATLFAVADSPSSSAESLKPDHKRATVALCHEWLSGRSGSEKTFEAMAEVFSQADLFAMTLNHAADYSFSGRPVTTTFLDRLGPLKEKRAGLLPLMPLAWRYCSRRSFDLVVTSSHACAKGFWPARSALHLCYCYTPMRYVWLAGLDQRQPPGPARRLATVALKSWDLRSVEWVDEFAAISHSVRERIERLYQRPAEVIHPPVATDFFTCEEGIPKADFALAVSRMVGYKRLDLAIRACSAIDFPLVIAGCGPQERALRDLAAGSRSKVEFVIGPDDRALRDLYRRARMLLFPADEDFGIVPVEAQACGTPVVALARGGSLDTVADKVTGLLVAKQQVEHFAEGLQKVLDGGFTAADCRANAERFSGQRFRSEFETWVRNSAAKRGLTV